uniref:RUN domain-containing protein n=1 Tax=Ascaris lumbricoides TaxID=6252 RepID=A0A0M3I0A8_ASCLU
MEILDIFLQVINFAGKMMKEEDENVVFDVADLNAKRRAISADSDDESVENERLAPIGESSDEQPYSIDEKSRLRELEEEQQRLNNSLLSLTTHFAQVQFRLKQVAQADDRDRDVKLLKELQEFAFKGCADLDEIKRQRKARDNAEGQSEEVLKNQKRQMQLIDQLREQLTDLEKFAYETGQGGLPSNELIAKQKAVLDKLHERMQLNLELDKMSYSDLQKQVDEALKQLVDPMRAKEQLVEQLQTQIVDLERFVSFLQVETPERPPTSIASMPVARPKRSSVLSLVGCGSRKFERNELKNTLRGNHYGDVRARLELAVDATVNVCEKYLLLAIDSESPRSRMQSMGSSSIDEVSSLFIHVDKDIFERSEEEVVWVVRKELCPALRHLLEHGMNTTVVQTYAPFTPFGCFPARSHQRYALRASSSVHKLGHIWDVILYYFDSKNGREFSDAPVRKLSQSFQLNSVAGRSVTSKQILLSTIENVVATHSRLKRSPDAMWKAFVSAALNEKKLPAWIRIIFRTREIVESCFQPWAYVARTGCEDCYELLERLHKYHLELPVDLAVRPFHQMKDAF